MYVDRKLECSVIINMTICRWLTPLQNQQWAETWNRKKRHQNIGSSYLKEASRAAARVEHHDKMQRKLRHSLLMARAKEAKDAARSEEIESDRNKNNAGPI